jgi:hypothetical protein
MIENDRLEESDMQISFSINCYDNDGEAYDEGIFVWINNNTCIRVGSIFDLESMITQLERIRKEILANYGVA